MDGFTFTTEILKAITWPLTIIALVILLKKPILDLFPLMKKLKYKDFELEFSQEIQALRSGTVGIEHAAGIDKTTKPLETSKALDLVSYSTRAAIIEAWIELETAAVSTASSFWNQGSSDAFRNYSKLGDYLNQCGVLDDKQLVIFNKLRELRNKSAHAEELDLGENDARAYVELASNLAWHIKNY